MGKWLKKFEEINHYEAFRESDDYLLPNVSWITSSDEVMYNPDVKEIGPKVTLRYRSTADNLLAFCNGGDNVKSLKIDGKNIEFEPLVNGLNEVEILNSEVKINYEAESEYEMFDFPDSYAITSLPSSIVVKPKDSNVKIGDIGNMMLFATMSGMKMCQPMPFEEMNGMFVIDEENNQLVCTEEFLSQFEAIISYGYGYGFGFCTVNEETGEFTVVDSLLIYEGITGGLKTPYYFDKEGEHIVEMELMSGDFGGMYMFFDMMTEIGAPLTSVIFNEKITSIGQYTFCYNTLLTEITCESIIAPTLNYSFGDIAPYGTLIYPEGSDYSSWLSNENGYLGYYGWNRVLSDITVIYNVTGTTSPTKLLGTTSSDIVEMVVDGVKLDSVVTGYTFDTTGEHTVVYKMYDIPDNAFYKCTGLTSVVIPNSVTSISYQAFYDCKNLTSVTIGSGVTSIENYAFQYCSSLTSVVIPNSVTKIGIRVFDGCYGLTSVVIPDSVTSIGNYVFHICTGLTSVVIPDSVTSIGEWAFGYCYGLTSVVIPDSVTKIGTQAFNGCSGLTSLIIGSGVTSIGNQAFSGCYELESIVVNSNNTVYDSRENCNCIIETSTNTLIQGCKNSFIPDSVTSIGRYAFDSCRGLTSVVIPDSVITIGFQAFEGCSGLTSVVIGSGCTSIGSAAFQFCYGLTEIVCHAITAPTISSDTFQYVKKGGTLLYPAGSDYSSWLSTSSYYLGYYEWNRVLSDITVIYNVTGTTSATKLLGTTTDIVEMVVDGVKLDNVVTGYTFNTTGEHTVIYKMYDIPYDAFSGCQRLTEIVIPESVTEIGTYAFYKCTGLTSVVIPNSVTSISYQAFYDCKNLTSVTIGSGVTSIENYAFQYCSSLTSVVIPNSVTEIGIRVFDGCSLETIVVSEGNTVYDSRENCNCIIETSTNTLIQGCNNSFIPDSVTSIGNYAFKDCSGLTGELVIPDSVTTIGVDAFYNCRGLTGELIIPDLVTEIGSYAFYNCSGLTGELVIPDSVTTIGVGAFYLCSGLTGELIIPDSVTTIGDETFRNCSGLISVVIPYSVTSIGNYAFFECRGLTGELIIPNLVTSIGNAAFAYCGGLTGELVIPDSVTSIGELAFRDCSGLTGELVIPDSVTTIGYQAFSGCGGLTGELIIPDSVTSIGNTVFESCYGLTSVVIPDSVTSIGDYVFHICSGLTSVVIPDSVTSIGRSAFGYGYGLTSVTIGSGVTSIGEYAFSRCSGLTEIVCHAPIAPTIDSYTFNSIKSNGVLKVPVGSDYSTWMSTDENYLGYNNWTIEYI